MKWTDIMGEIKIRGLKRIKLENQTERKLLKKKHIEVKQ
jgi:hypothetical protein